MQQDLVSDNIEALFNNYVKLHDLLKSSDSHNSAGFDFKAVYENVRDEFTSDDNLEGLVVNFSNARGSVVADAIGSLESKKNNGELPDIDKIQSDLSPDTLFSENFDNNYFVAFRNAVVSDSFFFLKKLIESEAMTKKLSGIRSSSANLGYESQLADFFKSCSDLRDKEGMFARYLKEKRDKVWSDGMRVSTFHQLVYLNESLPGLEIGCSKVSNCINNIFETDDEFSTYLYEAEQSQAQLKTTHNTLFSDFKELLALHSKLPDGILSKADQEAFANRYSKVIELRGKIDSLVKDVKQIPAGNLPINSKIGSIIGSYDRLVSDNDKRLNVLFEQLGDYVKTLERYQKTPLELVSHYSLDRDSREGLDPIFAKDSLIRLNGAYGDFEERINGLESITSFLNLKGENLQSLSASVKGYRKSTAGLDSISVDVDANNFPIGHFALPSESSTEPSKNIFNLWQNFYSDIAKAKTHTEELVDANSFGKGLASEISELIESEVQVFNNQFVTRVERYLSYFIKDLQADTVDVGICNDSTDLNKYSSDFDSFFGKYKTLLSFRNELAKLDGDCNSELLESIDSCVDDVQNTLNKNYSASIENMSALKSKVYSDSLNHVSSSERIETIKRGRKVKFYNNAEKLVKLLGKHKAKFTELEGEFSSQITSEENSSTLADDLANEINELYGYYRDVRVKGRKTVMQEWESLVAKSKDFFSKRGSLAVGYQSEDDDTLNFVSAVSVNPVNRDLITVLSAQIDNEHYKHLKGHSASIVETKTANGIAYSHVGIKETEDTDSDQAYVTERKESLVKRLVDHPNEKIENSIVHVSRAMRDDSPNVEQNAHLFVKSEERMCQLFTNIEGLTIYIANTNSATPQLTKFEDKDRLEDDPNPQVIEFAEHEKVLLVDRELSELEQSLVLKGLGGSNTSVVLDSIMNQLATSTNHLALAAVVESKTNANEAYRNEVSRYFEDIDKTFASDNNPAQIYNIVRSLMAKVEDSVTDFKPLLEVGYFVDDFPAWNAGIPNKMQAIDQKLKETLDTLYTAEDVSKIDVDPNSPVFETLKLRFEGAAEQIHRALIFRQDGDLGLHQYAIFGKVDECVTKYNEDLNKLNVIESLIDSVNLSDDVADSVAKVSEFVSHADYFSTVQTLFLDYAQNVSDFKEQFKYIEQKNANIGDQTKPTEEKITRGDYKLLRRMKSTVDQSYNSLVSFVSEEQNGYSDETFGFNQTLMEYAGYWNSKFKHIDQELDSYEAFLSIRELLPSENKSESKSSGFSFFGSRK